MSRRVSTALYERFLDITSQDRHVHILVDE